MKKYLPELSGTALVLIVWALTEWIGPLGHLGGNR